MRTKRASRLERIPSPPQPKIESGEPRPAGCKNKFQFPAAEARQRASRGRHTVAAAVMAGRGEACISQGPHEGFLRRRRTASSSTRLTRATCWTSPRGTLARGRRRRRGGGRGTTALAATTPGTSGSGRGKVRRDARAPAAQRGEDLQGCQVDEERSTERFFRSIAATTASNSGSPVAHSTRATHETLTKVHVPPPPVRPNDAEKHVRRRVRRVHRSPGLPDPVRARPGRARSTRVSGGVPDRVQHRVRQGVPGERGGRGPRTLRSA